MFSAPYNLGLAQYSDARLLRKAIRVLTSVTSSCQYPVTINYLRLLIQKLTLGTSKDLVRGWMNDLRIKSKAFTDKEASKF